MGRSWIRLNKMDKFCGNWETVEQENWDKVMKALEVGWITRKAALYATSYINLSKLGDTYTLKWKIAVKTGTADFKEGQEFEEWSPDGRKVKTTCEMDGDTFKAVQRGEPADTHISRIINEQGQMIETIVVKDVQSTRIYKPSEVIL